MTFQETYQEPFFPPLPKVRIDIVFNNEKTADKFGKYFKSKKEVRTTEMAKTRDNRYQLTIIIEKEFAEEKVFPSITKIMGMESVVLFAVTNVEKTMVM
jgi:hypothetical protein